MLFNASGVPFAYVPPTPDSETEKRLRNTLQSLDELLDIMWVPVVFYNQRHQHWEGRYALTCRWPRADGRWKEVYEGRVPEVDAYDIVGWLCEDMQDPQSVPTGADGITDRVFSLLGSMDNTRYPWKDRMLKAIGKNAARQKSLKDEALDLTHDVASYYYRQAKNVPQSSGADFNSEGKLLQ